MRKGAVPRAIRSASLENSPRNIWGAISTAPTTTVVMPTETASMMVKAFRTRSSLRAPKLKPTTGWAPWQKPCTGRLEIWATENRMLMMATALSPP